MDVYGLVIFVFLVLVNLFIDVCIGNLDLDVKFCIGDIMIIYGEV